MTDLQLTPASIGNLVQVILYLAGCIYLLYSGDRTSTSRRLLAAFFGCMALHGVVGIWATSSLRWTAEFTHILQAVLLFALVPLLQFGYFYPARRTQQELERWIVLVISLLFAVAGAVSAGTHIYWIEKDWSLETTPMWVRLLQAIDIGWVGLVMLRLALRLSRPEGQGWIYRLFSMRGKEARAARSYSLLAFATLFLWGITLALDYREKIEASYLVFSIGSLWVLAGFSIIYLNNAAEPTTVMVKLSGIPLVTLLSVMGMSGWLIAPQYFALYRPEIPESNQTLTFYAYRSWYDIYRGAFDYDYGIGSPIPMQDESAAPVQLRFPFAFAGQVWKEVWVDSNGLISFGKPFFPDSFRYRFGNPSVIMPLFMDIDPTIKGGVYVNSKSDRMVITWHQVAHYNAPNSELNVQVVLLPTGTFKLSYGTIRLMPSAYDLYRPHNAPQAIGYLTPATDLPQTFRPDVDLPATGQRHLGMIIDIYVGLRGQIHGVMLFLGTLIVLTSLAILVGFPFFFRINLLQPLFNLVVATRWVEADQDHPAALVPVQYQDEIGYLTQSFNGMVERMSLAQQELRKKNETLQKYTQDRERDLEVLYQVAAIANAPVKMELLMGNLLSHILVATECSMGAVLFLDSNNKDLAPVAHIGLPAGKRHWMQAKSSLELLRKQVLEKNTPLILENLNSALPEKEKMEKRLTYLGVSIRHKSVVYGILELYNDIEHQFLVENIALLSAVAGQLGVAIESIRLRHQAEATAILEERQRLARDLHDSVTQTLYSLNLLSQAGRDLIEEANLPRLDACMNEIEGNAKKALKEMRLMLYQLRPSLWEEANLIAALQYRLDAVESRSGVRVNLSVRGKVGLSPETQAELYYIAIEALNNVLKHSQSDRVDIEVRNRKGILFLRIRDYGIGYNEEYTDRGFGLQNMAERAQKIGACLKIESIPGAGTSVSLEMEHSYIHSEGKGEHIWER